LYGQYEAVYRIPATYLIKWRGYTVHTVTCPDTRELSRAVALPVRNTIYMNNIYGNTSRVSQKAAFELHYCWIAEHWKE
jgi:hypothetical protein